MSETFSDVGIPTTKTPDGRIWISDEDVLNAGPAATEFISQFSNYWRRDPMWCGWVSPLPDQPERATE